MVSGGDMGADDGCGGGGCVGGVGGGGGGHAGGTCRGYMQGVHAGVEALGELAVGESSVEERGCTCWWYRQWWTVSCDTIG